MLIDDRNIAEIYAMRFFSEVAAAMANLGRRRPWQQQLTEKTVNEVMLYDCNFEGRPDEWDIRVVLSQGRQKDIQAYKFTLAIPDMHR
ncbi:hypothetical protein CDAR_404441 [Caerostris darwini]|uniref:Uncharacterized protein n=1 Tax=Caerostris darwini TaxID=1538125 RepID=A0AAV4SWA8_9ARAC|nr:hypothetical protein CDAR_404441 [Caerostris darwini]